MNYNSEGWIWDSERNKALEHQRVEFLRYNGEARGSVGYRNEGDGWWAYSAPRGEPAAFHETKHETKEEAKAVLLAAVRLG